MRKVSAVEKALYRKVVKVTVPAPLNSVGENSVLQIEACFLPYVRIFRLFKNLQLEFSLGNRAGHCIRFSIKDPKKLFDSIRCNWEWWENGLSVSYDYQSVVTQSFLFFRKIEKIRTVTFQYKDSRGAKRLLLAIEKKAFLNALEVFMAET